MIDRYLYPAIDRALRPVARRMVQAGISADSVSLAGFGLGLAAFPLVATGHFLGGLLLIAANRLMDGLDGSIARVAGPTQRGAFLDIALDFFFYATVPLAFALADPDANALAAACLVTGFVGTGSSFLAFSAIAAKAGREVTDYEGKGIAYLGGLTEGFETILLFVLMCLHPPLFPVLAYGFAALCLLTTLTRWFHGYRAFSPPPASQAPQTSSINHLKS